MQEMQDDIIGKKSFSKLYSYANSKGRARQNQDNQGIMRI